MPPRKMQLNEDQISKLAAINCSLAEIAAVMGCSVDTLGRRYAEVIEKGRHQGKSSLKRKMWETAMGGNITMMIWLSKQMLGYTDKQEVYQDKKPYETLNQLKAKVVEHIKKNREADAGTPA